MRAWIDGILAVLLSPECPVCTHPLEQPTRGAVCDRCWRSIRPLTPPLCDMCGDPLWTWRQPANTPRCPQCRRMPRLVESARAAGVYEGALRTIVHALKYEGRRSLARPLGAMMLARGADVLVGASCVVPQRAA